MAMLNMSHTKNLHINIEKIEEYSTSVNHDLRWNDSSIFYLKMNERKLQLSFKEYTLFDLITAPTFITAPPPQIFTLFSLIITYLTVFFLTFYSIFTYYRPLDDLLALVVENNFT